MTAINQHHMQTPVKLPVIYEMETPGPVVVHCTACRSRAFRQDDTLACIACGREIAEVRERRPAPVNWAAMRDERVGRPGRPVGSGKPKPSEPQSPGSSCEVCGTATSGRNATGRCSRCAAMLLREKAQQHRPPCVTCGEPTVYGRSARFCAKHLAEREYRQKLSRDCPGGCGRKIRRDSQRCLVCFNRWSNKRRKEGAA